MQSSLDNWLDRFENVVRERKTHGEDTAVQLEGVCTQACTEENATEHCTEQERSPWLLRLLLWVLFLLLLVCFLVFGTKLLTCGRS